MGRYILLTYASRMLQNMYTYDEINIIILLSQTEEAILCCT